MTEEKLKINLAKLRTLIARKPKEYTPEYALTFSESFQYYTNTSTINFLVSNNEVLFERGWPYPSYLYRETEKYTSSIALRFELLNFFGMLYFKNLYKNLKKRIFGSSKESKEEIDLEGFYRHIDNSQLRAFDNNKTKIFNSWRKNPIFQDKEAVIDQIEVCYAKKLWISCISTSFPLLDYIIRKYFNTRKIDRDVNHLLGIFKAAGITSAHLKPGFGGREVYEQGFPRPNIKEDLRLIGVGLSSFVDTASVYYGYHRKDFIAPNSDYPLNRHAVIHSSSSDFNSKENAVKLLTFIDLTLDLEGTFKILLKED